MINRFPRDGSPSEPLLMQGLAVTEQEKDACHFYRSYFAFELQNCVSVCKKFKYLLLEYGRLRVWSALRWQITQSHHCGGEKSKSPRLLNVHQLQKWCTEENLWVAQAAMLDHSGNLNLGRSARVVCLIYGIATHRVNVWEVDVRGWGLLPWQQGRAL